MIAFPDTRWLMCQGFCARNSPQCKKGHGFFQQPVDLMVSKHCSQRNPRKSFPNSHPPSYPDLQLYEWVPPQDLLLFPPCPLSSHQTRHRSHPDVEAVWVRRVRPASKSWFCYCLTLNRLFNCSDPLVFCFCFLRQEIASE